MNQEYGNWEHSYYQRDKSLNQKFWEKVDVGSKKECWEWLASKNKKGYGNFYISIGNSKDKHQLAHRMAWMLSYGDIPNDLFVLHKCDNPGCVNPNHLFLGTNQDNMNDMVNKGRSNKACGENHSHNKLANSDVLEIRKLYATGDYTYSLLAKNYNIDISQVSNIINRKQWKHI